MSGETKNKGGGVVAWRAHQALKRLEERNRDKRAVEEARDIIYGPGALLTVYGLLLEVRRLRRSVAWYKSRRISDDKEPNR